MIKKEQIFNTLFFDIETVSLYPEYSMLPNIGRERPMFKKKYLTEGVKEEDLPRLYKEKAGLHAEFSSVLCIVAGYFTFKEEIQNGKKQKVLDIETKKFYGSEDTLIQKFFIYVNKYFKEIPGASIGGYNIKEFDIPFLMKRALACGITYDATNFPSVFDVYGKKSWELTNIFDVFDVFKFTSYKGTSLDSVAHLLGYNSPKETFDASDIHDLYFAPFYSSIEPDYTAAESYYNFYDYQSAISKIDDIMEPILDYCEGDVVTTMNAARYFSNIRF